MTGAMTGAMTCAGKGCGGAVGQEGPSRENPSFRQSGRTIFGPVSPARVSPPGSDPLLAPFGGGGAGRRHPAPVGEGPEREVRCLDRLLRSFRRGFRFGFRPALGFFPGAPPEVLVRCVAHHRPPHGDCPLIVLLIGGGVDTPTQSRGNERTRGLSGRRSNVRDCQAPSTTSCASCGRWNSQGP